MRRIFLLFAAFFACNLSYSQSPPFNANPEIDTTYLSYVRQVFGQLEQPRITTGILSDYGFEFADLATYNGVSLHDSTLIHPDIFHDIYKTLFTSRITSSVNLRNPSVQDSLYYSARQEDIITLSGLAFKFNSIQANANTTGKMQTVNGRLKDVYINSVWQNPYDERKLLAITPSITLFRKTSCTVVLPANLWQTNMSSEITSISLDASDGLGYRTIALGTPITVSYTDTGWKHWVFRVILSGGQQLFSHTSVFFDNASNGIGTGGILARGSSDAWFPLTATDSYLGKKGKVDLVISYRNPNDRVLRKPLIIAEGFDPGRITTPEQAEGQNTFRDFMFSVARSENVQLMSALGNVFDGNALSEYDIVYVNWKDGTDYLQRNAYVLEDVIKWVNARKQPLNGVLEKNVVLGSSMGGVIARMALGKMDRTGGASLHDTRLFISLDAPQQGANVPLGIQAGARHGSKIYIASGPFVIGIVELVNYLSVSGTPYGTLHMADRPAAKQLLNNRLDNSYLQDNTENANFRNELRTQWGYPTNIRCVAISNGSECAIDQEFTAGATILHLSKSLKTRVLSDMWGSIVSTTLASIAWRPWLTPFTITPGTNKFELNLDIRSLANGGGNNVYAGNIKYTKKVLWLVPVTLTIANKSYNAPTGLLPLDTYPGSFFTIRMDNQFAGHTQNLAFVQDGSFSIIRRFAFVHITSSLDIGGGNSPIGHAQYIAPYVGGNAPVAPYNSPFANFITAFNTPSVTVTGGQPVWSFTSNGSEPHEGLRLRNTTWLVSELNAISPQIANCSGFCANQQISGSTYLCNTQTIGVPAGAGITYSWSVNNPSIATLSGSGSSVQLNRVGSAVGSVTVTLFLSGICGTQTLNKTFTVGEPTINQQAGATGYTVTNGTPYIYNDVCPSITNLVSIVAERAATVTWTKVTSAVNVNWWATGNNLNFYFFSPGQTVVFKIVATSPCGTVTKYFSFRSINCGSNPCGNAAAGYDVSPNPASTSAIVTPNVPPPCDDVTSTNEASRSSISPESSLPKDHAIIKSITVMDVNGKVINVYRFTSKQKSVKLNLSTLQPGIYLLDIRGDINQVKKIIVTK